MVTARRIPKRTPPIPGGHPAAAQLGGWESTAAAQSPVAEQLPIKSVRVFERLCPASVDPSAGTWQDARTACPDVAAGMVFTLTSGDPSYPQIPLTVNALGEVEWREVPSGVPFTIAHGGSFEITARPGLRVGSPAVSIPRSRTRNESSGRPSTRIVIGASEPALSTYQVIECYWFDIPKTAGVLAEPDPTVAPTSNPAVDVADTTNAGVLAEQETQASASPETSEAALPDTADASITNAEALTDPGTGARVDIRAWQCPFHFDYAAATVG